MTIVLISLQHSPGNTAQRPQQTLKILSHYNTRSTTRSTRLREITRARDLSHENVVICIDKHASLTRALYKFNVVVHLNESFLIYYKCFKFV